MSQAVVVLLVAQFVLLGGTSCATMTKLAQPKDGDVVVTGNPRICAFMPNQGCRFRLEVRIPRPTPEMFCPKLTIETYHGAEVGEPYNTSTYESDCEPWHGPGFKRDPATGQLVDLPGSEWQAYYRWYALGPGTWTFRVTAQQGAVRQVGRVQVEVMGG